MEFLSKRVEIGIFELMWISTTVLLFILCIVVYLHNRKSKVNLWLSFFLYLIFIWMSVLVFTVYVPIIPAYYYYWVIPNNAYIGLAFYLFTKYIINDKAKFEKHEIAYFILGFYFTFHTIYKFADPVQFETLKRELRLENGVLIKEYSKGIHYIFTTAFVVIPFVYGIVNMVRNYIHESDIHNKRRALLILIAVFVGFLSVIITNNLLPMFGIYHFWRQGAFGLIFSISLISYSVLYHKSWRTEYLMEMIELKEKELRKRNLSIEKDLDMARILHSKLFPEKLPEFTEVDLHAVYIPMDKVGGDFYDFNTSVDNRLGIFISDVSGHGISGAFLSSVTRMVLRNLFGKSHSPKKTLELLNSEIVRHTAKGYYLTAIYGEFDMVEKTFHFANAGHIRPILHRRNLGEISELRCKGKLIGVFDDIRLEEVTIKMDSGDRLLVYTDGVIECNDRHKRMYGEERLYHFLRENSSLNACDLSGKLVRELEMFSGAKLFADDLTFVVLDIL
ncbi:MAG: serine/threonine-protein phosphatase [Leptospira sp.]|nr:serine/threonine-protein phosphatase [Leptospira sp.]